MIKQFPKPPGIIPHVERGALPWRSSMTLCVAAQCIHRDREYVVFAADLSVETSIAKAEIEIKTMSVCDEEFPVLIAGSASRARELITHIQDCWTELNQKKDEDDIFLNVCRKAVRRHKFNLASEYVAARYGVAYEDLLKTYRTAIPEEQYRELMFDINRMKLGCDLIIAYFDSTESLLFRINDDGTVEICNHFAAIGSGLYLAEGALFQREHAKYNGLSYGLYHVYEAMRVGSHAPGVGEDFLMATAYYDVPREIVKWFHVREEYEKLLEKQYKRFGPKDVKDQVFHPEMVGKMKSHKRTEKPQQTETGPSAEGQKADAKSAGEGQ